MKRILFLAALFLTGCERLSSIVDTLPGVPVPGPTPITQGYPNDNDPNTHFEYPKVTNFATLAATPTSAVFTWQWSQGMNTPDIAGFVLSLGTAPLTYSHTVTIADPAARTTTVTGLDLTKFNYATIQSYTDFGLFSVSTPEVVFGGTPTPPFQLKATPTNP